MQAALEREGLRAADLCLDAPLEGKPVTIRPGAVVWEGVDLLGAGALLLEAPVYSWPQPLRLHDAPADPQARARHFTADREARALALSAIFAAAEIRPVVNPPGAGTLAASPAVALDRLEAEKAPVHPWRLGPAPAGAGGPGGPVVLDAAGRDRWHRPSRPPEGEPALILEPVEGEVLSLLVAGGRIAGGARFGDAAAWAHGEISAGGAADAAGPVDAGAVPAAAASLAAGAARRLGLHVAAVALAGAAAEPRILFVEAGPDLSRWDLRLGGRACDAIAALIAALARGREGAAP
jgi:hypothetical protein